MTLQYNVFNWLRPYPKQDQMASVKLINAKEIYINCVVHAKFNSLMCANLITYLSEMELS